MKKNTDFRVIKGKKNKITLKKIIIFFVIISIVFFAGKRAFKIIEQEKKIEELQDALDNEKTKNSELLDRIEYLKSPRGIEEIARKELGYVKEDEILIKKAIIINPEEDNEGEGND